MKIVREYWRVFFDRIPPDDDDYPPLSWVHYGLILIAVCCFLAAGMLELGTLTTK